KVLRRHQSVGLKERGDFLIIRETGLVFCDVRSGALPLHSVNLLIHCVTHMGVEPACDRFLTRRSDDAVLFLAILEQDKVGIAAMRNFSTTEGLLSTFSLTTWALPAYCSAT